MKNLLLLLATSGILFAGCNSKQFQFNPDPIGKRYVILRENTWKLVRLVENGSEVSLKDCQLDNVYVFNIEGWGYMHEGNSKCGEIVTLVAPDPTDPVDTSIVVSKSTVSIADDLQYDESGMKMNFNWSVSGDQRELLITDFGHPDNDPVMLFDEMDATHFIVHGAEQRDGKIISYIKEFRAL